ncbi:hypothetical protein [Chryseobacterium sp.]|uniref:hypothetical protein n=1 Tax=Chryseobacterium sp. TaxID=1871047 RepID=UPI0025C73605|nr:hypothetical protein [Chryseobacterium sp.]MBV8325178.1 hypothetical protein [Chryseobacterium sp.]
MKNEDFNNLLGKTRNEIKDDLGDGFNLHTSDIWTYDLGKTWIGRRIILSLRFENKKVIKINVFKTFKRR